MSKQSGTPIFENQCVKWENKIVGWKDITDEEYEFSNDIPMSLTPTLDELKKEGYATGDIFTETLPSPIVPFTVFTEDDDVSQVPIEGISWLLLGLVGIILYTQVSR